MYCISTIMTRKLVPRTCDNCGLDIEIGTMNYKLQISQRGGTKGKFVKADNDADMCHPCFLNMGKNGYKPKWATMQKNPDTNKWETLPEPVDQEKLTDFGRIPLKA